jgi:hypothetical protein
MSYQTNITYFINVTWITYIHVSAQTTSHDHANYHIKGKAVPLHSNRHRAKVEEHLYPYSTLALDGVGVQHHTLDALPPRKRPYTQHTGGCVGLGASPVGTENLAPRGFETLTLQPIAGRYTDYAVPAPQLLYRHIQGKYGQFTHSMPFVNSHVVLRPCLAPTAPCPSWKSAW